MINRGGAKKFLYTGPNKGRQESDEDQWSFTPRQQTSNFNSQTETKNDLDNVWSLKHIHVGKGSRSDGAFTNNRSYYSRHGGLKDKDEFGSSFGNLSSRTNGYREQAGKSWNMTRPGFSYSQTKPPSSSEKPDRENENKNNVNSRYGGSSWNFGYKPPW